MASQQKVTTYSTQRGRFSAFLDPARAGSDTLTHLRFVSIQPAGKSRPDLGGRGLQPVVTLSELATQLGVSVQTLYDLRSQGRGPRGFRVGRELRFRVPEVEKWLAGLEEADAERHSGC